MTEFFTDVTNYMHSYYQMMVELFPKILLSLLILTLSWLMSYLIKNRLKHLLYRRIDDPLLARFILRTTKTLIYIIAALLILKVIGLGDTAAALWGTAGLGAFIIGFAFKDIFEHFLAGILLAFDRPFRVGDIVELDGNKGTVVALTIRTTHIKTFDGQDVYIPNGNIIKNALKNYTIDGFMRHEFVIGLDYGSDINRAIEIILQELNSIPEILKEEKAPAVVISDLTPSTLNLSVLFWLDTFDKTIDAGNVKIDAVAKVLDALDKAGFYLPSDVIEIKRKPEKINPNFAA
ncbi:MAG: mechanosensitive ion channel family protein [Saprospiraceae bacterium]|nr:mechanosensitive ion channel family protein [Saprospiraceae bacterium]